MHKENKLTIDKRKTLPVHIAAIWDELSDSVIDRIGNAGLEALCGQVHRMREAERRITDEGMVVQDSKGNPMPHPALAIEKQAQAEIRSWTDKFGKRTGK